MARKQRRRRFKQAYTDFRRGTASYAHDEAEFYRKQESGYRLAALRTKSPVKLRRLEKKATKAHQEVERARQSERRILPSPSTRFFGRQPIAVAQRADPRAVDALREQLMRVFPNAA